MAAKKSKLTLFKSKIKRLDKAQVVALEKTAEALHTEVVQAQVVPRETGALQNENFFVDNTHSSKGTVSLVHSTPYARRLYFHPEYNFNKDENPNAKGKWFEDWMPGGSKADHVNKIFVKNYEKEAGL